MQITVSSFGFSHGAMEADYVFDLRFLPNPFWVAELKPYPGTCLLYTSPSPRDTR